LPGRSSVIALLLVALAAGAAGARGDGAPPPNQSPPPQPQPQPQPPAPPCLESSFPPVVWHRSRAVGLPWRGRLVRGVLLPREGDNFFTWDPVRKRRPNGAWRRWGHDRLICTLLRVAREYRQADPAAPRVGVGDISRHFGGPFGERFGGLGHGSHQYGLDVDVWYPRLDGLERRPSRVRQIDRARAQDLVDRFVAAGAKYVFVGPHTHLTGPRRIVRKLVFHDDHMHVRLRRRKHGR
jgi:murein endopeptidase